MNENSMDAVSDEERKAYHLPKHRICPIQSRVPQNHINWFQDLGTAFWPSILPRVIKNSFF
jgi:hypothetical protein